MPRILWNSAAPAVTAFGIALSLVGCGGSSTPAVQGSTVAAASAAGKTSAPAGVRSKFAASRASLGTLRKLEDRACTRLVDQLAKLPALSSKAAFVTLLDRESKDLATFNATIYRLSAPPADAANYKHFVDANEGALDLFRRLRPYLVGTNTNKSAAQLLMERAAVADRDAKTYAHRLRLSACATGQRHRG